MSAGKDASKNYLTSKKKMNLTFMRTPSSALYITATKTNRFTWVVLKSGLWEFIDFTKPTEGNTVLLVLDEHYSHIRNLEVILQATS